MENVLVTGGAGFIGSNFIQYLFEENPSVQIINLDALTYAGNNKNLEEISKNQRYHFVHGNICDEALVENIFSNFYIDTVVHFAAETHVDRSINNPMLFIQTNTIGTTTLLNAALKFWLPKLQKSIKQFRFHHISTDEVYGSLEPDQKAFTENSPYFPNSPYAASKAASDHLVRAYYQTYHLPVTISNCSNNYGPYQFPEKLIPLTIENAIHGKPLPIYGDGKQIRDWLYVRDHCNAIVEIIEKGEAGESFNIGGNNQPTNLEIVTTICEILGRILPSSANTPYSNLIRFVSDRPGHDRRYAMDITKIKSRLGWEPKEKFQNGLEKTVKWYLDHPDWINSIVSKEEYQKWIKMNYEKRIEEKK